MQSLVVLFSLLIAAAGVWMLVRPDSFSRFMLGHADSVLLHVLAVVLRIVLGFALLVYAPESRFPLVLEILGWVAIAAALVLALLPRARFRQLLIRVFDILGGFIRFAAVAAIAFAAFLTYAVI